MGTDAPTRGVWVSTNYKNDQLLGAIAATFFFCYGFLFQRIQFEYNFKEMKHGSYQTTKANRHNSCCPCSNGKIEVIQFVHGQLVFSGNDVKNKNIIVTSTKTYQMLKLSNLIVSFKTKYLLIFN